MMNVILGALLPVIVTLALGMLAGWRRDEDTKAAEALNRMVLVYALPLALFAGTITVSRQELVNQWPLLLALLAGTVLPFLLAFLVDRYLVGRTMQAAALQAMAFGFPAIAFTGIPILTPLIGGKATIVVDVAGLTGNIVILPVTLVLLSYAEEKARSGSAKPCGGGQQQATVAALATMSLRHAIAQPVVLAPLFAIAFVFTNIHLPNVVTGSFKLLGSTVGGISLFASGIILQSQSPRFSLSASISTLARLLVIPVLAYLALTAIGQSGDLRKMTVLALGLAAAPMQVILSTRYGCDKEENASVLLYSNVLSIPSLAFLIWLTQ
jgi:malonate transporter